MGPRLLLAFHLLFTGTCALSPHSLMSLLTAPLMQPESPQRDFVPAWLGHREPGYMVEPHPGGLG